MDRDSKFLLRKIILDFLALFAIGFPILLFYLFGKPYHRGFFCNDESLLHPFKESTVSNTMLYIVGLFLPIAVIIATEYLIHRISLGHVSRTFMGRAIPSWVWNSYQVIGIFGFGAACSQLTTDIAKYSIGRLRPHFIDVCKPDIDCKDPIYRHKYIENFNCLANQGSRMLKEVRLSFPSGHSSFSAYTMLFVAMYLQSRMTWRGSKLLRHALQYICLMLCWATAMSRISNYKHHWSDVLTGLLLGSTVAIITVVFVSDLFKRKPELPETQHLNPRLHGQSGSTDVLHGVSHESTENGRHPGYKMTETEPTTDLDEVPLRPVSDLSSSKARQQRPYSPRKSPNPAV